MTEAIAIGERWGNVSSLVECYLTLGCILRASGDEAGATELQHTADALRRQHGLPWLVPYAAAEHARLGNVTAAVAWVRSPECHLRVDDAFGNVLELQYLLLARALIDLHRPQEALRLLERLLRAAEAAGWLGHAIAALAFQALAWQASGAGVAALAALSRALALAEPEDYVRLFVDQGPPMADLLRQVAAKDARWQAYVDRLLAVWPSQGTPSSPTAVSTPTPMTTSTALTAKASLSAAPLVEPLSERELEILRLLVAGASNRDIARTLILAVGTVKTHIHNIYGKLAVDNRLQVAMGSNDEAFQVAATSNVAKVGWMATGPVYHIRVQGHLDARRAAWFEGMTLTHEEGGVTLIAGPMLDQAVLHGVLAKVRDLGLVLISVNRVDTSA